MKIIEVIFLMILLAFAAITAASEIAVIAVSKMRLRKRSAEGSKTAKLILTILETPERFFGTILVANNIVDALIASLVTAIIIHFMGETAWVVVLATAIVSFLIIVSEVAAKTLAARNSEKMAFFLARPVKYLIAILSPIVRVFEVITNAIVSLIGGKAKAKTSLVTEEELKALIKIGEEDGVLQKDKYKMLTKGLRSQRNRSEERDETQGGDDDHRYKRSYRYHFRQGAGIRLFETAGAQGFSR